MKIERLISCPDRTVGAVIVLATGDEIDVVFTTTRSGGIAVASPDRAIFDDEDMDAASVRAVVAAVLAFASVAAHPSEQ